MVDWLAPIEAAYDIEGDETSWLRRVIEASASELDDGMGLIGYTYHAIENVGIRLGTCVGVGNVARGEVKMLQLVHRMMPSRFVDTLYFTQSGCTTLSAWAPDFTQSKLFRTNVLERFHAADVVAVNAVDVSGSGVVICGRISERRTVADGYRDRWKQVCAHIAVSQRLRRKLGTAALLDEGGEAIFDAGGRCHHAEGEAESRDARATLREAVRRIETARGPRRRSFPEESLDAWSALVEGRWSLVDTFDSDGRRYIVARPNGAELRDPRALTEREREVVRFVALGHSNKLIAYEMGLSISTVATHLRSAERKLGVASRVELVHLINSMRRSS